MLLIHDLAEIGCGDVFLYDEKARREAFKKEESSLKELVSLLPEDQAESIMDLWYEFEQQKTGCSC